MGVLFRILAILIFVALLSNCKEDSRVEPEPSFRKIKQSIKIHDDNANGSDLRLINISLSEPVLFFYNEKGLLDSLVGFSDSTFSHIKKTMKVLYRPQKITAIIDEDTTEPSAIDFYLDGNKNIIKMVDTLGLNLGFHFTYQNNKIDEVILNLGTPISILNNFIYDQNNNLIQYTTSDSIGNKVKVNFEYNTQEITSNLDIKFASGGIRFLYAGGINVLSLMGINYGVGNKNQILSRIDKNLVTGVNTTYLFDYTRNNLNEIIARKIIVNDTIDVYYNYIYE